MATKGDLTKYIGQPCWFMAGVLEIRKRSDAVLSGVDDAEATLTHSLFNKTQRIPLGAIASVVDVRK